MTVALQGEHGKPRPALVIQSDLFAGAATVTVLPLTSARAEAPLIRIDVAPSPGNGLRRPSQVMIDKAMTVRAERLGAPFGRLDDAELLAVSRALALFLGIAR